MDPRDAKLLPTSSVLDIIENALAKRRAFSFVRCGDGTNICMAQGLVPINKLLTEPWAVAARASKDKGVPFPSLELRDRLLDAIRRADLVGIHRWDDRRIMAPPRLKRALLDRVLAHHRIIPKRVCDAVLTRDLPLEPRFWAILRKHRVVLVSRWAAALRPILTRPPYSLAQVSDLSFDGYAAIANVTAEITRRAQGGKADVLLVSAGMSAPIIAVAAAPAPCTAIDFGKAMQFMVEGKTGLHVKKKQGVIK